ncbi:MAG: glycosyltransferase family 1 protein [Desulfobacterales bacterium]|nr:glycosyltransferase family 1 protein [Desulfobacterales bacterium]
MENKKSAQKDGTCYSLEVLPEIPETLKGLNILSNDLLYSWDRRVRGLFYRIDSKLWGKCGHNPKVFLRRVSQKRLKEKARDRVFMEEFSGVMGACRWYHKGEIRPNAARVLDPGKDLIAYFCAEFGFHESLPIYSGGLGILAGDLCKAASDLVIPFVAVGLLYHQGYFTQTIDAMGSQIAEYHSTDFNDLPVTPAVDGSGREPRVFIELPDRTVCLKVWKMMAGHVNVYLLDSDLPENTESDRTITHRLYGGNEVNRILQEIALGIGGVRALRALGLSPTVWHINEGHAAFLTLERCREWVERGLDFDSALELTAAGAVFTTHTPIPAGHDIFDQAFVSAYFTKFVKELGIDMDHFLSLGVSPDKSEMFNMTALALRGSRFHNGVSKQHGKVASEMESYIWPGIPPEENPMGYVTNGIHVPTFLRSAWARILNANFGGEWRNQLRNKKYWERLDDIPDHQFWSIRKVTKSKLLEEVRSRVISRCKRNRLSQAHIARLVRHLSPDDTDILIMGFARRFIAYKRPTLIFDDPGRLAKLLNNPEKPVLLIFAGKAHPRDESGQELIRTIHEYSLKPEFEGKIILLENYDLVLARWLVTGTDVLLNTPENPLEASGTSGIKAGVNGVINLSTLVGWWEEGYNGKNGWAITSQDPGNDEAYRNKEEARQLLDILENLVIPLYFDSNGKGYSEKWIRMSKNSMKSIIPRFSARRMVMDYVNKYYDYAIRQGERLSADNGARARELALWKKKVKKAWPGVRLYRVDQAAKEIPAGKLLSIEVAADLAGLAPGDVSVVCLVGEKKEDDQFKKPKSFPLTPGEVDENGKTRFRIDLKPPLPGLQYYKIRAHPHHELLSHPFETGCMEWL